MSPGSHDRLGATMTGDGVDFCVYARRATGLDLLLFGGVDDMVPARVIHLDPGINRTGDYWHVHVRGIAAGQLYGFAADGPWDPDEGLRFDATRLLLDPYGRGVATPSGYRRLDPATAPTTRPP